MSGYSRNDAIQLSKNLRPADIEEIAAFTDASPREELLRAFESPMKSKIFAITAPPRKKVLGMFGISDSRTKQGTGVPWMLASMELFGEYRIDALRNSKAWLNELCKGYDLVENYVYAKNTAHIWWIEHMGFTLVEYLPEWRHARLPFWRFQMYRNSKLNLLQSMRQPDETTKSLSESWCIGRQSL